MFSLNCVWINGWVNNGEAGDLRRYRAHNDVIVMNNVVVGMMIYSDAMIISHYALAMRNIWSTSRNQSVNAYTSLYLITDLSSTGRASNSVITIYVFVIGSHYQPPAITRVRFVVTEGNIPKGLTSAQVCDCKGSDDAKCRQLWSTMHDSTTTRSMPTECSADTSYLVLIIWTLFQQPSKSINMGRLKKASWAADWW